MRLAQEGRFADASVSAEVQRVHDTTEAGAYPIILVTYEIVCSKYSDAKIGSLVKSFLTYTAGQGQSALKELGYAPLPASIQSQVTAAVATIS